MQKQNSFIISKYHSKLYNNWTHFQADMWLKIKVELEQSIVLEAQTYVNLAL